ncbi:aminopeptidase N-like [Chironomus tepperi]|uniref:aminopeptidase N-like n=1 Tax=Chironomus tepperi TaxID=113505 RepID=UPI00391F1A7F
MWKSSAVVLLSVIISVSANILIDSNNLDVDNELGYRLPNNTVPISYDIQIDTHVHANVFNFQGNVKIHVKIVEATDSITLHYRQIEILKVDILLPNGVPLILNSIFNLYESRDFVVIALPRVYQPNTEFILDISYQGALRNDAAGFYRGSYLDRGITRWYAATQFQIDYARHAMPCFDEPGLRATMKLSIRHGRVYQAISNTDVVEYVPDGSYVITRFAATPAIPTYLLAFIVSDFGSVNANATRVPQKLYGTPLSIQQGYLDFAASKVGSILNIFEMILRVNYPLSKMDHAALSQVSWLKSYAMENYGLITYAESELQLNPSTPAAYRRILENRITSLISGKFAQQWFGNTVSPKWWTYVWLSEGFATFFEAFLPHLLAPEENFMDKFFEDFTPNAFNADEREPWPMNQYVESPNELRMKFNQIVSRKAACVIRMYKEAITDDVFFVGLNKYLTDNLMKSATPNELHAALQAAYNATFTAPLNIAKSMSTWEDQPGYPVVHVSIDGNEVTFKQQRYPLNSEAMIYSIPITLATKTKPSFTSKATKIWLDTETESILQVQIDFTPGDWMVVNLDQVGYFRVDYDLELWRAIIDQLYDDHKVINRINRAVLFQEFDLARNKFNRVYGVDSLGMINYLRREKDSTIWNRAQPTLSDINYRLFGTAAYDQFFGLIRNITKPHLEEIGYEGRDGEDANTVELRGYTKQWNCLAVDGDCVARDFTALILLRMGTGSANFDFCNALKITDRTNYAEILEAIITDRNAAYRNNYMFSMGCSLVSENLDRLLEAVLDADNGLLSFERWAFLDTMTTQSNMGLEKSLDFLNDNYVEFHRLADDYRLTLMAERVKEAPMVAKFKNLLEKLSTTDMINSDSKESYLKEIEDNQEWLKNNYYDILMYFGLEAPTIPPTTTTIAPTTPGSGNSIFLSIGLVFVCLIINLLKN